jgi:hypothetical protein
VEGREDTTRPRRHPGTDAVIKKKIAEKFSKIIGVFDSKQS